MPSEMRRTLRQRSIALYGTDTAVEDGSEWRLRAALRLNSQPDRVLTGLVVSRHDASHTGQQADVEAVLVLDNEGNELYRNAPTELADWRPERQSADDAAYRVRHQGRTWHVAETVLQRHGWRFIALTSARRGQAISLTNIPRSLAALINLAIFGALIGGSAIARRISGRVLAMAELVREMGAEAGKLRLPVHGRDELGYLAETLNRMSAELGVSIRRLQETTAEKERLAAEMELARQMQKNILPPEPPHVLGYELAAASRPALEVGGDFYDHFVRPDGSVVIMIGDAAGKGLGAAMFITETHALARAAALYLPAAAAILRSVNSAMMSMRRPSEHFVTMLCAVLEPNRHRLLYASAGHNPPILFHEGQVQRLESAGLPLAFSPEVEYPLLQIELAPADAVVFYTDGVTDAADADGNRFGVERLEDVVRRHAAGSPSELRDAILRAVRQFAPESSQYDDITLIVLRHTR